VFVLGEALQLSLIFVRKAYTRTMLHSLEKGWFYRSMHSSLFVRSVSDNESVS
jgi:hypothetical protein